MNGSAKGDFSTNSKRAVNPHVEPQWKITRYVSLYHHNCHRYRLSFCLFFPTASCCMRCFLSILC
ncbi:hypothetical protein KFK09_003541 [Dendrobium nobile]|uniref:Uncharacterized protein n=1 Tax=Dendrobium nobile TaxID=94219 RepID=A0A8T3C3B8_DENNO|nr:hypothetical protein KFK09_003541 [Dendrobium nobile]